MRAYAVPTIAAGANAVLSIFFFVGISHAFGDTALGRVVLVQATAAIVLIATMPQCGPYMIAAQGEVDAKARYGRAVTLEAAGLIVGFLLLVGATQIPWSIFDIVRDGALLVFWSLAVQGMGSCQGWLRVREHWRTYALWVIFPNLIRVPMILLVPMFAGQEWVQAAGQDPAKILLWFFLVPDLARMILIVAPVLIAHYRPPPRSELRPAARLIGHNWLYDIGSQITDVADKLVVGALLGPPALAAYFFARRIGATTSMVTEPFYWERYRQLLQIPPAAHPREQSRVFGLGLALAASIFAVLSAGVAFALSLSVLRPLVPMTIMEHMPLFFGVLLFDCLLAANRWSRFLSQLQANSLELFIVRIATFIVFSANVTLFGDFRNGVGTVLALGISAILEGLYLRFRMLRRASRLQAASADAWPLNSPARGDGGPQTR